MSKQKNILAILRILCACIFSFMPLFVYPQQEKNSVSAMRARAMDFYRKEIANASINEVRSEDLGVWGEILDSTLFMLIRHTEVYRGRMRLIIEDNRKAKCKIFPDGTILVSTAIFDFIDTKLASSQNMSPRRIKNFNAEREKMLASFFAFEVADFALDNKTLHFTKYENTIEKDDTIKRFNLESDYFAMIILELAGYSTNLFYDYLEQLKDIQNDAINSKQFESFFEQTFPPQKRITHLLKIKEEAEVVAEDLSYILDAIQSDNYETIEDAKQKLIGLKNVYPKNLYLKRLVAIIAHKKWATNLNGYDDKMITAYPVSMQNCHVINKYFSILNNKAETLLINQSLNGSERQQIPGNIDEYDEAVRAYKSYLSSVYEAGVASSYATLLFYSPNTNDRAIAISLCEQASLNEYETESLVAIINYSALLYISGKDYTKAKLMLENIMPEKTGQMRNRLFLGTGKIIDDRIILYNYTKMLFGLGEKIKAEKIRDKLKLQIFPIEEYSSIPVKKIKLGDTIDDLTEYWGNPTSIKYNYFSEVWKYDFLNAQVLINTKQNNIIEKIFIFNDSVLSVANNLRTGETRKACEAFFGKPIYTAGDIEIYFYKANKIHVLYLNNYIKTIFLTKA